LILDTDLEPMSKLEDETVSEDFEIEIEEVEAVNEGSVLCLFPLFRRNKPERMRIIDTTIITILAKSSFFWLDIYEEES
jgi:hypothetical protein